jgi:hypothetical protein
MRDYFLNFPLTVDVAKLFDGYDIIGPMRGVPYSAATDDSPEQPAIGDTKRQYVSVRTAKELPVLPKSVATTDAALSIALLGVWADYDGETKQARVSYLDATGKKQVRNDATLVWAEKLEIAEVVDGR